MCERTVGKGSAGCAVMRDYHSIERRIVLLQQLMFCNFEKWQREGLPIIKVVVLQDIDAGTELTVDYHWQNQATHTLFVELWGTRLPDVLRPQ